MSTGPKATSPTILRKRALVGDARLGVSKPTHPPLIVRVLCAYKYIAIVNNRPLEQLGFTVIQARSSRGILSAFVDAVEVELLADWPRTRGPRPRKFELAWYLPENGKGTF